MIKFFRKLFHDWQGIEVFEADYDPNAPDERFLVRPPRSSRSKREDKASANA